MLLILGLLLMEQNKKDVDSDNILYKARVMAHVSITYKVNRTIIKQTLCLLLTHI